jgi:hypothetical protein
MMNVNLKAAFFLMADPYARACSLCRFTDCSLNDPHGKCPINVALFAIRTAFTTLEDKLRSAEITLEATEETLLATKARIEAALMECDKGDWKRTKYIAAILRGERK